MFLDVSWLNAPRVFISSTMDDPSRQYRRAIIKSLSEMGLTAIEFQDDKFPYSMEATKDVINETLQAVRATDVFLLIVGKRYGYVYEGKSVVHLEYLEALSAEIPVFSFVDERVWSDFRRDIKASEYIESEQHFGFLKNISNHKVLAFRDADECISHIKSQLNNFLGGCLRFSRRATWLWNEFTTRNVERDSAEIWIVTPDFYWDFDDSEFRDIVTANVIGRGCKYRYIFKGTESNIERVNEMYRVYGMLLKQNNTTDGHLDELVKFLPVKPQDFFWSSEQILFNPFTLKESAIMVDIMDVRDKTLKFNIEYGRHKRVEFRKQFISYWNRFCKPEDVINII